MSLIEIGYVAVLAMLALVCDVTVGAPVVAMVRPQKGFVQPVVPLR
jgi:hypothetical protein